MRSSPRFSMCAAAAILLSGAMPACSGIQSSSAPPPSTPLSAQQAFAVANDSVQPTAAAPSTTVIGREGTSGAGTSSASASKSSTAASERDGELVVDRDVVARCPGLRSIREHAAQMDPDKLWLGAVMSIADCMSDGGALSKENLGVSGDPEHRHLIRQIMGSRGVAPTRVIAARIAADGAAAAECQGASGCGRSVILTIAPNP